MPVEYKYSQKCHQCLITHINAGVGGGSGGTLRKVDLPGPISWCADLET